MRFAYLIPAVALVAGAACSGTPIEPTPPAPSLSITTTTTCNKDPGPTNTEETTATNPKGKRVPGQSSTTTVSNQDSNPCK
jgi:hypothetical protein